VTAQVRELDPGDASDVRALAVLRAATHDATVDDGFVADVRTWLELERGHRTTWLAEVDDRAVGYVSALHYRRMPSAARRAGGWAYLGNLFVLPDHRGQGLGEALVRGVEGWARELGLARVVLAPSRRSVPLYRRLGYRDADELLVLPLG
jgi:GNAT superfamily N-acetyltransferase